MAVLPQGMSLDTPVAAQRQPSLSWRIDKAGGRIVGMVDGLEEVRQAVQVILSCERFRWQIYEAYSGMEWSGLIGQEPGYVAAELQRRLTAALTVDDRILGTAGFSYSVKGGQLTAAFTVHTVYGDTYASVEAGAE